jgi:hypothetical protein
MVTSNNQHRLLLIIAEYILLILPRGEKEEDSFQFRPRFDRKKPLPLGGFFLDVVERVTGKPLSNGRTSQGLIESPFKPCEVLPLDNGFPAIRSTLSKNKVPRGEGIPTIKLNVRQPVQRAPKKN